MKETEELIKDQSYSITIVRHCLCERSHGLPKRFRSGETYRGRFEKTSMHKDYVCFYIDRINDFVYFPTWSISWEEYQEKQGA